MSALNQKRKCFQFSNTFATFCFRIIVF